MSHGLRFTRHFTRGLSAQIVFVLFFQLFCLGQALAKPNLRFEHLFENLPGGRDQLSTLTFILRDHNGMMWFAGEKVFRYDGVELRNYSPERQTKCAGIIRGMVEDQDGVLWLATGSGLCSFDEDLDAFKPFHTTSPTQTIPNSATSINVNGRNELYVGMRNQLAIINAERNAIRYFTSPLKNQFSNGSNEFRDIFFESADSVWIGSRESGLIRFQPSTGDFEHFLNTDENPQLIPSNNIRSVTQDRDGNIWFASHVGGISRLDPSRKIFKHYSGNLHGVTPHIWHVLVDSQGQVWIGSDGDGLMGYDKNTDSFFRYQQDLTDATSIGANKAVFLYEDSDNNLWVGLHPSGIDLVDRRRVAVKTFRFNPSAPNSLNSSSITVAMQDSQNRIWIGTELGLNLFDPAANTFADYSQHNASHWSINPSPTKVISETADGNLWIGTWGDGLYFVNTRSQVVTHYTPRKNDPRTVDVANFFAVLPRENETWFASEGEQGILIFDHLQQQFRRETFKTDNAEITAYHSYDFLNDSSGVLWIATLSGLYSLDAKQKLSLHSSHQGHVQNTIPSFRVRCLFEDSKARLWIGTQDLGVFIYERTAQKFRQLENSHTLPSANVTRILESKDGSIWLFTTNGMIRVDADQFTFSVINNAHGLISSNNNHGAGFITSDDTIYAGGTDGLSIFNARTIGTKVANFPVHITSVKMSDPNTDAGKSANQIKQNTLNIRDIKLNYRQNIFTFSFAGLSYPLSSWNEYAYKLAGFEDSWNHIGNQTTATYTNIPAGRYDFQVKAKDSYGNWSNAIDTITVSITPPPWKTFWAYCVYAVLLVFVIGLAISYKTRQLEYQKEKAINQEILRLNQEKDEMRRNFIADVSHELKTPMSILAGELEAIEDGIRPLSLQSLSSLGVEIRILNKLVNDLFDLSLADVEKLKFSFQPASISEILEQAIATIASKYLAKDISLTTQMPPDPILLNVDPLRIHQLFLNLLENSFRYTDAPGQIQVAATITEDSVVVAISDTEPGVAPDNLGHLFQRFYREEPSRNRASGGTGLGLSICRHIADAHHALITASNSPMGGLCITIKFPRVAKDVNTI